MICKKKEFLCSILELRSFPTNLALRSIILQIFHSLTGIHQIYNNIIYLFIILVKYGHLIVHNVSFDDLWNVITNNIGIKLQAIEISTKLPNFWNWILLPKNYSKFDDILWSDNKKLTIAFLDVISHLNTKGNINYIYYFIFFYLRILLFLDEISIEVKENLMETLLRMVCRDEYDIKTKALEVLKNSFQGKFIIN